MKKIVIVGIVLTTISMVVFSAGTPQKPAAAEVAVSASGVYPIVEEKVTLHFMGAGTDKEAFQNSWEAQHYEEKTNVHIEWELVPEEGKNEKRKLILAAGDLPDVFFEMSVTYDEQIDFGAQGYFVPLNDYIKEHGYYLKKINAQYPEYEKANITPDGNQYSLAMLAPGYHSTFSQKLWVNRFWLEDLGMDPPKNTDDMYRMLKAFKTQDLNKNGKTDEIPLSGSPTVARAKPWEFIMNAFIYNDESRWIRVKNGKVEFVANTPEWRNGLRYMKKLFDEGLVDPLAFTQDQKSLQQTGEATDVILGATGALWPGNFTLWGPSNRSALYEPIAPIEGPEGHRSAGFVPRAAVSYGEFVITKECPYPLVAFKWADLRYDEAESLNAYHGPQDTYWRWAKPGEVGAEGNQAVWSLIKKISDEERLEKIPWGRGNWNYAPHLRHGQAIDLTVDIHEQSQLEVLLYKSSKLLMEPHKPAEYYPADMDIWMNPQIKEELTPIQTALKEYMLENTTRFIMGDLDIESDWNAHVGELDKIGVARYLQLLQQQMDLVKKL